MDLEPEAPTLSSSGCATFPDNSESAGRPDPPPLLSSSGGTMFPDHAEHAELQPIAAGKLRIVGVAEWQNIGKQSRMIAYNSSVYNPTTDIIHVY